MITEPPPRPHAQAVETTPANGDMEWHLGVGGATIYAGHGMERVRIATVHGSTELIPHAEQQRNARLIVNAARMAETLRALVDAIWDGRLEAEGAETFTDPARRVLAQIEGRAE